MCRIAGITSKVLSIEESCEKVQKMCFIQQHGGPDDEGIFADKKAGLVFGHRRLSIIDLSSNGHQPMADTKKRAWITFNGEIYNYQELKESLLKIGAEFCTGSDTEVIIQAYLNWGTASFGKLSGMFAFALHDTREEITYLVRDTNGIKPLYYHIKDNQLSFASEVQALKAADIATLTDYTWTVKLLAFGNIPEPYTTLKDTFSLPKGSFLSWQHGNCTYSIQKYAYQSASSAAVCIHSFDEAMEAINHTFKKSIKRQLISDAPIGVFLSGGVDSSLLTLLAEEQKKQQLKTISIFFDENLYDERQYQNLVFDRIQGEKFTHLVKQKDFDTHFPNIMSAMDMPTTDGINSWFISNYAHHDGLKAVLSGIGADEIFGGYPSFKRIKYLTYLRKLPAAILNLFNFYPADQYRKIGFLAHKHHLADYLLLRGLFSPADIAKIHGTTIKEIDEILFNTSPNINLGKYDNDHASWFENNLYMQNQLLRDTDVMSMSHGLEVRVPFLDEEFNNVVKSISPKIRFNNTQPKKLLINSFSDILPKGIQNRVKMGFTFPLQQWMRENEQINNNDLYTSKEAKTILNKFQKNQLHWSKLFALYQIQQHV